MQTNPGTQPGPLMKVASGGELSRFLLALKVVLSDRGSAPTLVFDEIDTGVGGAVADAIGARLARLAGKVQVMAVTHAPQVAARADQHLLISKDALDKGKRVATRVDALADDHRREEIARMLAGAEITAEARAAAERLIKAAAGVSLPPAISRSIESMRHDVRKSQQKHRQSTVARPLTKAQAKVEHKRLALEIEGHDKHYYQDDAPKISDADYDALRQRVERHRGAVSRTGARHESPSQKVGAQPSGRFAKVQHAVPMLSLGNAFSDEDVTDFVDRVRRFLKLDAGRDPGHRRRAEDRRPVAVAALRERRAGRAAPRAATATPARTSPPMSAPSPTFRTS